MSLNTDKLNGVNMSPLPAPTGLVAFVIQRPNYFTEWFAGWNACGPMWTSRFADACEVRADLLVSYMLDLAMRTIANENIQIDRGHLNP